MNKESDKSMDDERDKALMESMRADKAACYARGHVRRYATEIEYRGVLGMEKARYKVAADAFYKNPSSENWQMLEECMTYYQNIHHNCSWRRGSQ